MNRCELGPLSTNQSEMLQYQCPQLVQNFVPNLAREGWRSAWEFCVLSLLDAFRRWRRFTNVLCCQNRLEREHRLSEIDMRRSSPLHRVVYFDMQRKVDGLMGEVGNERDGGVVQWPFA
jgi:hypothetical protein